MTDPSYAPLPPVDTATETVLYLYVQKTGTRSWIQRLVIRERKWKLGLGSVQLISLAEAASRRSPTGSLPRRAASACREAAAGGRPPPYAGLTPARKAEGSKGERSLTFLGRSVQHCVGWLLSSGLRASVDLPP